MSDRSVPVPADLLERLADHATQYMYMRERTASRAEDDIKIRQDLATVRALLSVPAEPETRTGQFDPRYPLHGMMEDAAYERRYLHDPVLHAMAKVIRELWDVRSVAPVEDGEKQ